MKLAELSRQSRISAATIKYYLREGMLQPGTKVRARLSEYDESHLRRLDLIDALIHIVGLSISQVKTILAAVDDPQMSLDDVLTRATVALPSYGNRARRYSEDQKRIRKDEEGEAAREERLEEIRNDLEAIGFDDLPDPPTFINWRMPSIPPAMPASPGAGKNWPVSPTWHGNSQGRLLPGALTQPERRHHGLRPGHGHDRTNPGRAASSLPSAVIQGFPADRTVLKQRIPDLQGAQRSGSRT